MSDEQQEAAEGRILRRYRESRAKLAALKTEARDLANHIRAAAAALDPPAPANQYATQGGNPYPAGDAVLASWPEAHQVRTMLRELRDAFEAKRAAEAGLKELGIELKE